MDPIKQAFDKIKQDISLIKQEIDELKHSIEQLKQPVKDFKRPNIPEEEDHIPINTIQALQNNPQHTSADPTHNPTQDDPFVSTPTHNPTIQQSSKASESQNNAFSTGNRGVPTDKPTDRQTNQQTDNTRFYTTKPNEDSNFNQISEVLSSLDSIKKEVRNKFKRLTPQEMMVFSALYHLQEQEIDEITYKIIAQQLRLSESSIRDYVTKILSKGIPIEKTRLNNKKITLKISQDLLKIATLSTINKLREL